MSHGSWPCFFEPIFGKVKGMYVFLTLIPTGASPTKLPCREVLIELVASAGRISNNLGWPGPTTKIAPRTVRQNLPQLLLFFLDCLLYLVHQDHLLFCGLWDRFSLLPVGSKNNVQYEKKIHQHVAVIHHFPTDLASSQEIMTPPNLNQSHLHPWFVAFPTPPQRNP